MSTAARSLAALIAARRPDIAATLAADSTVADEVAFDPVRFETTFAALGRRLGVAVVGASAPLDDDHGHTWPMTGWGLDEIGRGFLLVAGLGRMSPSDQPTWLDSCYRAGALRERQAILRVLALLPEPRRFLSIALDAGRASTQPIFEALACENPYPAAYFPEPSFNQLVMKAVFTEVPLARILGLMERRTPELARMATDYASERRAAGRSVAADLALVLNT